MTDDTERVAMCAAVKHEKSIIVKGSTKTVCAKCGQEVWISASTIGVLESGYIDEVRCCCCCDMCDINQVVGHLAAGELEIHIHEFVDGICACSIKEEDLLTEADGRGVHDILDFFGAIQDALREAKGDP